MAKKQRDDLEQQPPLTDGASQPNAEAPGQQQAAGGSDEEERRRRIAERAYYNAERRGFASGGELDDWLQAEQAHDKGAVRGKTTDAAQPPEAASPNADSEIIEPNAVKEWAGRLNVSPTRLRNAIHNVGSKVPDVRRFLEERRGRSEISSNR